MPKTTNLTLLFLAFGTSLNKTLVLKVVVLFNFNKRGYSKLNRNLELKLLFLLCIFLWITRPSWFG